jgi:predicted DNA-binding transcriptional regulator AlpA
VALEMSICSCGSGKDGDKLIVDGRYIGDDGIDITEVMRLLGVSESSVWRGVKDTRVPTPFYPQPRAARWVRKEIIAAREAMRLTPTQALAARLELARTRKKQPEPIAG